MKKTPKGYLYKIAVVVFYSIISLQCNGVSSSSNTNHTLRSSRKSSQVILEENQSKKTKSSPTNLERVGTKISNFVTSHPYLTMFGLGLRMIGNVTGSTKFDLGFSRVDYPGNPTQMAVIEGPNGGYQTLTMYESNGVGKGLVLTVNATGTTIDDKFKLIQSNLLYDNTSQSITPLWMDRLDQYISISGLVNNSMSFLTLQESGTPGLKWSVKVPKCDIYSHLLFNDALYTTGQNGQNFCATKHKLTNGNMDWYIEDEYTGHSTFGNYITLNKKRKNLVMCGQNQRSAYNGTTNVIVNGTVTNTTTTTLITPDSNIFCREVDEDGSIIERYILRGDSTISGGLNLIQTYIEKNGNQHLLGSIDENLFYTMIKNGEDFSSYSEIFKNSQAFHLGPLSKGGGFGINKNGKLQVQYDKAGENTVRSLLDYKTIDLEIDEAIQYGKGYLQANMTGACTLSSKDESLVCTSNVNIETNSTNVQTLISILDQKFKTVCASARGSDVSTTEELIDYLMKRVEVSSDNVTYHLNTTDVTFSYPELKMMQALVNTTNKTDCFSVQENRKKTRKWFDIPFGAWKKDLRQRLKFKETRSGNVNGPEILQGSLLLLVLLCCSSYCVKLVKGGGSSKVDSSVDNLVSSIQISEMQKITNQDMLDENDYSDYVE